ncbi:hypothetical protein ACDT12_13090 [Staphylococcus aureus]
MRNKALRAYQKNPDDITKENYKRAKGRAQWTIKTAKLKYWQDFCSQLNGNTNLNTLWRTIKAINGHSRGQLIPPIASDDGQPLSNSAKAEIFASQFALASSDRNHHPAFLRHKSGFEQRVSSEEDDSPLSDPISTEEVINVLRKGRKSAPGEDGIQYEMLRNLPPSSLNSLISLYNQSWFAGVLPSAWKTATVVPILKKGKPASVPSSYRPISLTSTLCKVMEKIDPFRIGKQKI